MYLYANSTTQRCPKEIIKIFLIEDFFHLPPVSTTPAANLELWISPRIFENIRNGPNGIIRGLGETDSWRKPEAKILWHCPFKHSLPTSTFLELFELLLFARYTNNCLNFNKDSILQIELIWFSGYRTNWWYCICAVYLLYECR